MSGVKRVGDSLRSTRWYPDFTENSLALKLTRHHCSHRESRQNWSRGKVSCEFIAVETLRLGVIGLTKLFEKSGVNRAGEMISETVPDPETRPVDGGQAPSDLVVSSGSGPCPSAAKYEYPK